MTNRFLVESALPALVELSTRKISGKLSFVIGKNLRKAVNAEKELNDLRIAELKKYCVVEDGKEKLSLYDMGTGKVVQDYEDGDGYDASTQTIGYRYANDEDRDQAKKIVDEIFDAECLVEWHKVEEREFYGLDLEPKVAAILSEFIIIGEL